jgi:hypothetical protein
MDQSHVQTETFEDPRLGLVRLQNVVCDSEFVYRMPHALQIMHTVSLPMNTETINQLHSIGRG